MKPLGSVFKSGFLWKKERVLWGACFLCSVGLLGFHVFIGEPMRQGLWELKARYKVRRAQVVQHEQRLSEAMAAQKDLLAKRDECKALLEELNQRDPYQFVSFLKERLNAQIVQGDLNVENYSVKQEERGPLLMLSVRGNIRGLVSLLSELESVRGLDLESVTVNTFKVREGEPDLNVVVSCRLLKG